MKTLILCLLLAVSCAAQSTVKPPEVNVDYDKFQKVTKLRMEASLSSVAANTKRYTIDFTTVARIPDDGKPIILFYFSTSPKWLFNQPTLRIMVNERLLEFTTDEIDNSVIYSIPLADFKLIANADTVDIQLIPFETSLDDRTLAGLKNLLTLTTPQPPR